MIPQEADQTHIEYGFPVLSRGPAKRHSWMYSGIGWKIGESFGCWTKPLAQYMSEIETTRTVDENIIHYTWFVEPVLVLFLWRTFSGLAQSFFSRLTKTGPIELRSYLSVSSYNSKANKMKPTAGCGERKFEDLSRTLTAF